MTGASLAAISREQVEYFWENGFLAVPRLIGDETVDRLRDLYDQFASGEIEAGEDNRELGGVTQQIMFPSKYHPYFASNPAIDAAREIAAQLAPGKTEFCFDMLITKPPMHTVETPWHQDHSYFGTPFAPAGVEQDTDRFQFWIALDDVDIANGCMQFVPGLHHKPMLAHHVASGDPTQSGRLLALTDPGTSMDLSTVVACPLEAGGCTIHTMGTPHYTGGNSTTDRSRRAYIINIRANLDV